jgi:hypothetical protein
MSENSLISSQSSSTKFASSNKTELPPQDVVVEDSSQTAFTVCLAKNQENNDQAQW